MRLHNPQTGSQLVVDDDAARQLLATGMYREGPAPQPAEKPALDAKPDTDRKQRKQTAAQNRPPTKAETTKLAANTPTPAAATSKTNDPRAGNPPPPAPAPPMA